MSSTDDGGGGFKSAAGSLYPINIPPLINTNTNRQRKLGEKQSGFTWRQHSDRIRDVHISNFIRDTGNYDGSFRDFPQFISANAGIFPQ
jgi:hypothetical protein